MAFSFHAYCLAGVVLLAACSVQDARSQDPPVAPSRSQLAPSASQPIPRASKTSPPLAPPSVSPSAALRFAAPQLVLDAGAFLTEVYGLAFSPDGRLLAASGEKVVRLFDVSSGELLQTLRGDRSPSLYGNTYGMAFSPDGEWFLVGVHDDHQHGSIRAYRTDDWSDIAELLPGHNAPCRQLEFSPDGKFLVSADANGQILVWDWPVRRIVKRIPPRNPDAPIVDKLTFSLDGRTLLTVESDGPHLYSIPDGRPRRAQDPLPAELRNWVGGVLTNQIQWPLGTVKEPRAYDFDFARATWAAAAPGKQGGKTLHWAAVWTSSSNDRAHASSAGTIYRGHAWTIRAVAISPTENVVASADKFGEIHLWDLHSGKALQRIVGQGKPIYQAAFDASMDRIQFGVRPDVARWSLNHYGVASKVLDLRGRVVRSIESLGPHQPQPIDEAPRLGDASLKFLAPNAQRSAFEIIKMRGDRRVSSYRMPTGLYLSTYSFLNERRLGVAQPVLLGDREGWLGMWDSGRDELARYFTGHSSQITSISAAPQAHVFVTGSTDRTIRLWSLLDHRPTGIFDFKYENSTVQVVPSDSSSAKAGVRPGDRILSIEGIALDEMYDRMLMGTFPYQAGQVVRVAMQRGAQRFEYAMKLKQGFDLVEPLLSIFIGDQDQWIMWTPQGYYDASPGADQLIGWHVNRGPEHRRNSTELSSFARSCIAPMSLIR